LSGFVLFEIGALLQHFHPYFVTEPAFEQNQSFNSIISISFLL